MPLSSTTFPAACPLFAEFPTTMIFGSCPPPPAERDRRAHAIRIVDSSDEVVTFYVEHTCDDTPGLDDEIVFLHRGERVARFITSDLDPLFCRGSAPSVARIVGVPSAHCRDMRNDNGYLLIARRQCRRDIASFLHATSSCLAVWVTHIKCSVCTYRDTPPPRGLRYHEDNILFAQFFLLVHTQLSLLRFARHRFRSSS